MKHPYFQLGEMVLVSRHGTYHGYAIVTGISTDIVFEDYLYDVKFTIKHPHVTTSTSYRSSELTKTFYSATMGYRELIMNLEKC